MAIPQRVAVERVKECERLGLESVVGFVRVDDIAVLFEDPSRAVGCPGLVGCDDAVSVEDFVFVVG